MQKSHDHLRDVPWEDIFNLGGSAAASEFCEWVLVVSNSVLSKGKSAIRPLFNSLEV